MSVCTFFGHRDCPEAVKPLLKSAVEALIREHGVDTFYVGNNGQFDAYVRSTLRQLTREHPHIRYAVVLAYLPAQGCRDEDHSDTMFPEGLENGPPRFAIERRNRWLLDASDYFVCYVRHSWGGVYGWIWASVPTGLSCRFSKDRNGPARMSRSVAA